MKSRILQVSDLHLGSSDPEIDEVASGLRALIERQQPALIVASGDLTHRNVAAEHRQAADLLRSLGPPVLAIPGNHDIPATPPGRLTDPFAAFSAEWGDIEPMFESPALTVVALNSVRGWLYQEGYVGTAQLARAARTFAAAPATACKVVVTHHHLASAPWRPTKRPLMPRSTILQRLNEAGVEVVLAGHIHQASSLSTSEFRTDLDRPTVLVTSPGLGRPRHGRHFEARGANTITADEDVLIVETHGWSGTDFVSLAQRRYPRTCCVPQS